MPSNPPTKTDYYCDRHQLRRVLALLAWMEHCNNDANVRYASFRRTEEPVGYSKTNDDFIDYTTQNITMPANSDLTIDKLKTAYPEKSNAPDLHDFLELMLFIRAINESTIQFVKNPRQVSDHFEDLIEADMNMYAHGYPHGITYPINKTDVKTKVNLQLANRMLDVFTDFRTHGFQPWNEQTFSGNNQKAYELLSSLHAIALDRRGSGDMSDEGSSVAKMVRRLVKAPVAFVLYPFFVLVGFLLSLGNVARNLFPDRFPTYDKSYGESRFYLLSSIRFSMGDAGRKYWAQAGFDDPSKGDWGSLAAPRKVLGYVSIGLVLLPEAIVKSFLFPIKWAFEYDQWAVDGYPRRFIDGLESTLIGILASPVIFFNHALAAIVDIIDKTFSMPENDPDLKRFKAWLENFPPNTINLDSPSKWEWAVIVLFKVTRFFLDTIPSILSRAITNTFRSIFPAIPGTNKESRNTGFEWVERFIYTSAFLWNIVFLGTLLALAIAGVAGGASVPLVIAGMFGLEPGTMTAAEFFYGAMGNVGNLLSTIGSTLWGMLQNPQLFLGYFKDLLVTIFTQNPLPTLQHFFDSVGLSKIAEWGPQTWKLAAIITFTVGIPVVVVVGFAMGLRGVQNWYQEKATGLKNLFHGQAANTDAITLRETHAPVQAKIDRVKSDLNGHNTSAGRLAGLKDNLNDKVGANNTSSGPNNTSSGPVGGGQGKPSKT